jgi:hypothetical protein
MRPNDEQPSENKTIEFTPRGRSLSVNYRNAHPPALSRARRKIQANPKGLGGDHAIASQDRPDRGTRRHR